jgi:hypothetical protein
MVVWIFLKNKDTQKKKIETMSVVVIRGKVSELRGNFQPGRSMIGAHSRHAQVIDQNGVNVIVFKGKIHPTQVSDVSGAMAHPQFVACVETNENGEYVVTGLEPNTEYTIVYETPDTKELYLNSYDSDGCWSTVTTNSDVQLLHIEDTRNAFF